ncbi:MAG TPA: GAF domain-containing protein [Leptolyngbyaceae cyanobacterium M33_DOE_097]|uniref:GAF domain-containing protein n=1 Tax=Oscillatoriales cyanobacterium SpSt-418 TaxID=2282169 RepID=A0A7C3PEH9_9CYAN|nr:GAF domain-containing protein [Leptolyngbyaceae cyanobacterium M33_DOE_097]
MQSSESVSYDASVSFINTVADDRSESPANGVLPQSHDRGQRRPLRVEQLEWLRYFHRCSRLLVAVLEPNTLKLRYANEHFCRLSGVPLDGLDPSQVCVDRAQILLESLLADEDYLRVVRLYRKHLLHRVLEEIYHIDPRGYRLLDEPVRVAIASVLHGETRYVEFGLRSEQLTISRINPDLDEFAELGWQALTPEALEFKLTDVRYLQSLVERLHMDNYRVEGRLLLEGVDVTANETIRRITQLLIDQDSILQPAKFHEVNQQINLLFRANNSAIASIDGDQVRLFTGSVSEDVDGITYSMDELRDSHLMEAVRSNRVTVVPDLAHDCRNEYGQKLLELGMRSLLILPLMRVDEHLSNSENILLKTIGAVGIMSDQPNNFDALDCRQAEELIPAFTAAVTAAQRQLVQRRFITNIHPSVEWRFLQEAERRSLGLPPEPIVFTSVYPLYGISDIRGSSDERNRAIQADLLEQFQLGLAIVEAAGKNQDAALIDQLRLDLLEQIHHLNEPVTVDAEVSLVRYLRDNLEVYFDYFALAGAEAQAAIAVYQAACDNPQNCVYRARAAYDSTVGKINAMLRETWERWQKRMQRISPHYCDIEATDGIDHMIYAGQSIDLKFGSFQLRSLRYEQLRAVCDCARTSFRIQQECNTNMEVTHLVLVQDSTVDIYHDETTERLFDVKGTRDTRYEIVKKRIDKALDEETKARITQPGMLTLVYSTEEEWSEYQQYLRYLVREGWIEPVTERGAVQPLQGVSGLKFARVRVLPKQAS